jgi:hypothetical protein
MNLIQRTLFPAILCAGRSISQRRSKITAMRLPCSTSAAFNDKKPAQEARLTEHQWTIEDSPQI